MAQKIERGLFITFEGPEGSGKSTHSKLISEDLLKDGFDALRTFEPGDTPLGQKIRNILLEKEDINLGNIAELFLFEADRAQHIEDVVAPAIKDGKIVICDRFNTATYAYQGYGLDLGEELIKPLDDIATGKITPDLVVLLDTDVLDGLKRASGVNGSDRLEKRGKEFHDRVRTGYLKMAEKNRKVFKVIKLEETIEDTYARVKKVIYDFIERYKGTG